MFLLSPEKLLVVLVVAMLVVGPERLPKLARQAGALWKEFHGLRARLEREAKEVFPDMPALETLSQAVRSPLSYLDRLADQGRGEIAGRGIVPATILSTRPDPEPTITGIRVSTESDQMASVTTDPSMN
jgi:Sec-independent protein translocase protein TatA